MKSISFHHAEIIGMIHFQCHCHEILNARSCEWNALEGKIRWASCCMELGLNSGARVKAIELSSTWVILSYIYVIIKLLTRFSTALMVLTTSLTLDLADTWVPLAITALFCSNSVIKVFFCSSVNWWYSLVLFFTRSWRTWLLRAGVAWAMTVSE